MTESVRRRAFVLLHVTLGIVVLIESAGTLVHALRSLADHHHMALMGGVEAAAAVLFLIPRTVKIGGMVLVAFFLVGAVAYGLRHEFRAELVVYAAAALFVAAHGAAWRHAGSGA